MKNPFIAVAQQLALMRAAFAENTFRNFTGKAPTPSKRTRGAGKPGKAGAKLARFAGERRLGLRHT